ncbi:MAG: pentapeptide repeat-containing protein, partial [Janthinobacterium lividum]
MSKRQADIIDRLALVETDVKLEKYAPKQEDVLEYAEAKRNNQAIADSSLNDYLKQKYFPAEKNIVIVADLSGMKFDNGGKTAVDSYIDLRDVDFSGSIMKDTEFIGCDMTNAIFCDTDLGNASFNNTKLRNVDFRGADLADCKFDEGYSNVRGDQRKIFTDGIKYSMTSYLGRYYADIKADAVRMREKREAIESKQEELNQQYAKLSYVQAGWASTGLSSGDKEYDKIALELSEMRRGKFPEKEYIMNKSFQNIFGSTSQEFDPLYIRGSDQAQRSEKKKYVPLTRNDVEEYLKLVKSEPELSLNDFAKKKFIKEATAGEESISSITKFIADFSGQVDPITQKWVRPDLTNLEFEGTDLKEVNFSGADLSNCKFIKADISRSTFESALVTKSAFSGTIAKDVNFFNADLQNAEISESNFQRAFMPKSNAESAQISKTDFDYSNIRGGKWDQVSLEGSTFNFANLEGISLINADIRKVKMQHAILADVMMSGAQIIESEFTGSLMEGVTAIKTKWENSSLEGIIAKNIDLT